MSLMVRVRKYSGWLLFLLILVYIVTGLSYGGLFGFDNLIDIQFASSFHNDLFMLALLIILLLLHCCTRALMSLKNKLRGSGAPVQNPPQNIQKPVE